MTWTRPSESRYGRHVPPGRKLGVRRADNPSGYLDYNGHRHIPDALRKQILAFVQDLRRPTTVAEVASELLYSQVYIKNMMRYLAMDGDLVGTGERTGPGRPVLYGLPGPEPSEPTKRCSTCREIQPYSSFGFDKSSPTGRHGRCRRCRSPKVDKATVRSYPKAREVTS